MQLFFIKNIRFLNLTIYHIAKRQPFNCPKSRIHQLPHHNLLRTSNNIIHLSPIASDFPPSTSPSHLVSHSSVPQAYPSSHSIPHQYHADIHSTFLQATAPYIHDFNKMPSLVSINKYNKAKLVELIDFFDSFPLLFNGERIKPT